MYRSASQSHNVTSSAHLGLAVVVHAVFVDNALFVDVPKGGLPQPCAQLRRGAVRGQFPRLELALQFAESQFGNQILCEGIMADGI